MHYVLVNGELVVEDSHTTGAVPGAAHAAVWLCQPERITEPLKDFKLG
ncbi:MAG: hypothetical protein U0401_26660 [Anaerolineae bacterium]